MPIALMAMIVIACGGEVPAEGTKSPSPSDTITVKRVEFQLAPANSTDLESLLARIPGDPSLRHEVEISNFANIRHIRGLEPPGPDAGTEELKDYMKAVSPVFLDQPQLGTFSRTRLSRLGTRPFPGALEAYDHLAFDARNVDQTIGAWAVSSPRGDVEVTVGRFDPSATHAALARCAGDCIPPKEAEYAGVEYYAWDWIPLDERDRPPLFSVGSGRVLVREDAVYDAATDEEMESVIDTLRGEAPSMADFNDFALIARALAGAGVNSAMMTDRDFTLDAQLPPHRDGSEHLGRQAATATPLLKPFQAAGAGLGYDGERNYAVVALYHENEAAAQENAERLVRRVQDGITRINEVHSGGEKYIRRTYWRERVSLIEVSTSGPLLVARLHYPGQLRAPLFPNSSNHHLLLIHE